jgi:hypothetical protein
MTDDTHEFTTDSNSDEQTFENTVDDTATVRLTQPIETNHDREQSGGQS